MSRIEKYVAHLAVTAIFGPLVIVSCGGAAALAIFLIRKALS